MRKSRLFAIVSTLFLIQQVNAQVELSLEASRMTGVAPLYVFFDATSSSGLSEGNDLVNSDFSWNFDVNNTDPDGTWEITKGMVAGHVFEIPGTYEVSCTITAPDGTTDTETLNIVVTEFEGTTYYVSNEGDDSNDGLSAENAWKTAEFAFQQLDANEQILFRKGDTFTGITQNLNNHKGGPIILGAYGTGASPILSSDDDVIIDIRNSEDIRVMDLHLIPTGEGLSEGFSSEGSANILALRLEIEQTSVRPFYQDDADLLGIFDCDLHDFGVMAVYSGSSTRFSFVGNTIDNLLGAPQPEHGMRIQGGEKQFIAHNNFTRLEDTKTAITIRGDGQRHVMVYRNKMDRILGVNPQNAQTVSAISYVTIEGNYVGHNDAYVGNKFGPTINGINIEATHISIRNNIIDGYYNAIFIGHDDNGVVSGMVDVYHNTVHWRPVTDASGTSGRIVRVRDVSDVTIQNNLISADDESDIEVVNNDAGSSNIVTSNNLITSTPGYETTTLPGSAAHLNNVENYLLSENSPAIDAGANDVPVFFDLFNSARLNDIGKDLGAFEFGSEAPSVGELLGNLTNYDIIPVQVYPNPFYSTITIKREDAEPQQVWIYDQQGKLLVSTKLEYSSETIDLSHLGNELFFLVVGSEHSLDRRVFKIKKGNR